MNHLQEIRLGGCKGDSNGDQPQERHSEVFTAVFCDGGGCGGGVVEILMVRC